MRRRVGERVRAFLVARVLERPARHQGLAAQIAGLERAGRKLEARLYNAAGTAKDREVLRHIIGIERWGQRRLEGVAAGAASAAAVSDAHQPYGPAAETSWDALIEAFVATRAQTVRLARGFSDAQSGSKVSHNDIGPLSVGGWLRYLRFHATFESRKVRPR
jgi:hypothetical protein